MPTSKRDHKRMGTFVVPEVTDTGPVVFSPAPTARHRSYVDPERGNDATGVVGDYEHPFKTMEQAVRHTPDGGVVEYIAVRRMQEVEQGLLRFTAILFKEMEAATDENDLRARLKRVLETPTPAASGHGC